MDGFACALAPDPQDVHAHKNRAHGFHAPSRLEAARVDLLRVMEETEDPELKDWPEGALSELDATE